MTESPELPSKTRGPTTPQFAKQQKRRLDDLLNPEESTSAWVSPSSNFWFSENQSAPSSVPVAPKPSSFDVAPNLSNLADLASSVGFASEKPPEKSLDKRKVTSSKPRSEFPSVSKYETPSDDEPDGSADEEPDDEDADSDTPKSVDSASKRQKLDLASHPNLAALADMDLVVVDIKSKFKHDRGTYNPGHHARFYLIGWRDTAKKFWRLPQLCKSFAQPSGFRRLFVAQPVWREVAFELMRRSVEMASKSWAEVYYAVEVRAEDDIAPPPPPSTPSPLNNPIRCTFRDCLFSTNSVPQFRDHIELHTAPELPGRISDRAGYCTRCAASVRLITIAGRSYNHTRPFLQLCGLCGTIAPLLFVFSCEKKRWTPQLLMSGTQVGAITASGRDTFRGVKGQRKHGGVEHRWFPKGETNYWLVDSYTYLARRSQEERPLANHTSVEFPISPAPDANNGTSNLPNSFSAASMSIRPSFAPQFAPSPALPQQFAQPSFPPFEANVYSPSQLPQPVPMQGFQPYGYYLPPGSGHPFSFPPHMPGKAPPAQQYPVFHGQEARKLDSDCKDRNSP